jgi:hypothetical protein
MYPSEFETLILGGMAEEEYQSLVREASNSDGFSQDYLDWCEALEPMLMTEEALDKMAEYYNKK